MWKATLNASWQKHFRDAFMLGLKRQWRRDIFVELKSLKSESQSNRFLLYHPSDGRIPTALQPPTPIVISFLFGTEHTPTIWFRTQLRYYIFRRNLFTSSLDFIWFRRRLEKFVAKAPLQRFSLEFEQFKQTSSEWKCVARDSLNY